jgi:hypothetical protein
VPISGLRACVQLHSGRSATATSIRLAFHVCVGAGDCRRLQRTLAAMTTDVTTTRISQSLEISRSHAERNSVKAAYSHAEHLQAHRQASADYLDDLRQGLDGIPLRIS